MSAEVRALALATYNARYISSTLQERTKVAASLKSKGNSAYPQKQYTKAAAYYTKAIEVTAKPEPVYYSNRAACACLTSRLA